MTGRSLTTFFYPRQDETVTVKILFNKGEMSACRCLLVEEVVLPSQFFVVRRQGHLRLPQPFKHGHLGDDPASIPLLLQVGIVPEARGMSASGRSLVPAKEFGRRGWWDGVLAVLVPFPCPGPATA